MKGKLARQIRKQLKVDLTEKALEIKSQTTVGVKFGDRKQLVVRNVLKSKSKYLYRRLKKNLLQAKQNKTIN